jgi:O-antigen ligase
MTASASTRAGAAGRDRLGAWCGWVLIGGAVLAPLLAWLGPLGFAPLLALMGLLSLPAVRLEDDDRPVLIVLLGALVWAAVSTTWSPYQPKDPLNGQALKLAAELPLYWSAFCGARRASPRLRGAAMAILAWALVGLGALLLVEAVTGGAVYRTLHERFYEGIRPDLAQKNLAQTTFVAAVLWPAVLIPRLRSWRDALMALVAAGGLMIAAARFNGDAPVLAAPLAVAIAAAVWRWPRAAPALFAAKAALLFLMMPLLIWALRASPAWAALNETLPLSWTMRMGYWSHALGWISDAPLRGWGLDSSRAMGPGIQLHPHNGELQVWLELGAVGAVAAAAFWGLTLWRLAKPGPSLAMAGAAASAGAYLLFATVNFGVWQEWWVALGALIAVISAASARAVTSRSST